MEIITKTQLSYYKPESLNKSDRGKLSLNNISLESASYEKKVFLSHKHTDIEHVYEVQNLLSEIGLDVYVDWFDEEMPDHTDAKTAKIIKRAIRESKKFILLATDAAIASKWCNWELGFADSVKSEKDNLVLFPLKNDDDDDDDWTGSEYMQLYPVIKCEEIRRSSRLFDVHRDYYVNYPDETLINLEEWLSKI